jgi:hypothetical protein
MAVTLKDVAARAGVSTATVARVIHENGYVSAQARDRVFVAIRESGYRLNVVAQGLRRQRTLTLGHMLHGILPNPFFAEVAMGVEHAAAEHGYNVLIFNARDDADRERAGVETLLARRVDGVIFTTALRAENVRLVLEAGVPAVEVEKPLCDEAASVVVDNYGGVYEAINHLLELGHREIGYPRDLYDAAALDGAGGWSVFRRITLPLLRPALLVVLVFRTLSAFLIFDIIYALTGGGPGTSTTTLSYVDWHTFLVNGDFGLGGAIAVVMVAVALIIAAVYRLALRPNT